MITRTLSRRLERLEELTMPVREHKVWQIVIVDSDGSRRDGPTIEWRSLPYSATAATTSQSLLDDASGAGG
jgi:hypothetical protein